MMRQRNPYRYALMVGILLFGFLTLNSLFRMSVSVGRPPREFKRFENPGQYWFFTGACLVLTATGVVVLVRNP
jgi:formate hydrogenlyase subunit 3/multisubunit Na+/H+ antiporter MnhD subunit